LETLRRWKPRMVIENNRESFDEIRGVLHSLNYEIRSVTGAVLSEQENATELHDIIAIAR